MPLTRTPHWATRELHQFLLDRASHPFAWGINDCCLFPADGIHAFTGVDLAAPFRVQGEAHPDAVFTYRPGAYDDLESAVALIEKITGGGRTVGDAAAWCAAQHGLAELAHPLMAQRGDLVTLMNGDQEIAGLVHLNGRDLVTVGEDGLVRLPITAVKRAWRI